MLEAFRNKRVLIENSPTDNSPDRILRYYNTTTPPNCEVVVMQNDSSMLK